MTRPKYLAPYSANHNRVRKVRGSADRQKCERDCGRPAKDWALIHDTDGTDTDNYVPLCRSCHAEYDRETRQAGILLRSQNPQWLAQRAALPRDDRGRYIKL